MERRDGAFDGLQGVGAVGFEVGHGFEKAAGVGVSGRVENVAFVAEFDQIAGVHDGDAVGDLRDDGEIVRDE